MPDTFDRILLPTDGSDAAEPAVEMALEMAQTHGATVHALYVVEPPSAIGSAGEGFAGLDSLLAELEEEGHEVTDGIAERGDEAGVEVVTAVQQGTPRETILEYIPDHDIDLVVMGTHGRTGIKRSLLGSVTEAVVRHADVPVMTIHGE